CNDLIARLACKSLKSVSDAMNPDGRQYSSKPARFCRHSRTFRSLAVKGFVICLVPRLERFSEAADQPVSQFFGFVDGEDQRSRRLQRDSESVFIGVDTKHDAGASTEDKVTFARGRFDWHGFPYPMVMASRRA